MDDHLTPDQRRLRGRARDLTRETAVRTAQTDRTVACPRPVVRRMAEAGFTGMTIPSEWGGPGLSCLDAVLVIEVTNAALQVWGAAGDSRDNPMERHVRDARVFAIAGGTAQVLRNQIAEGLLGRKLPQTREETREGAARPAASGDGRGTAAAATGPARAAEQGSRAGGREGRSACRVDVAPRLP